MPSFPDSAAKIHWAVHHLEVLEHYLRVFVASRPYILEWVHMEYADFCGTRAYQEFESRYKTINGMDLRTRFAYVLRMGVHVLRGRLTTQPKEDISCMIGDIAHNTRCALDYIVYKLSRLHESDTRKRRISFPICNNSQEWNKTKDNLLCGVDPSVVATISNLQPFNQSTPDRSEDPLILLREVNNADKHHRLRIAVARATITGVSIHGSVGHGNRFNDVPFAADQVLSFMSCGSMAAFVPIGNGELTTEESELLLFFPDPHDAIRTSPGVTTKIQFAEGQQVIAGHEVAPTLRMIINRVKEICEMLF